MFYNVCKFFKSRESFLNLYEFITEVPVDFVFGDWIVVPRKELQRVRLVELIINFVELDSFSCKAELIDFESATGFRGRLIRHTTVIFDLFLVALKPVSLLLC